MHHLIKNQSSWSKLMIDSLTTISLFCGIWEYSSILCLCSLLPNTPMLAPTQNCLVLSDQMQHSPKIFLQKCDNKPLFSIQAELLEASYQSFAIVNAGKVP